ncbi:ThuA domain-containing protein [Myceligenerans pegani]|uniref:ThuA domain-containing protein n=1 Tax=Myceligenerans pegani TaxID=2776917 RepID=A0ABR9N4T8_9MICO|nr:ThuA domain-containing protein [Myceligenerans sp. TRM 65318]MBE1878687.1 ThuA domain-containing protein [Myceligenerans sp. TRM 65318]MBE3020958.1 ThuA domain-containing protein [Myceligenerans sp. TRM 65318]
MTTRILVLAGRGRYEDPWHDHAATSHEVARILGAPGAVGGDDVVVRVRSTWQEALDDLDDVGLLVLNSGRGRTDPEFDGADGDWTAFHERLAGWARSGGAILALHQAANTFADAPGFEAILGGRWIPGVSMHPPIGDAVFDVVPGHPVTDGLGNALGGAGAIDAYDERYCHLVVSESSRVLLTTRGPAESGFGADDGARVHPVAWAAEAHGGRTVYSGLGHDVRSYGSAAHRAFLRAAAAWLLA